MPETFLRLSDVAEQLQISKRTLAKLTASGSLKTIHIAPRVVRVRQSDLNAYVASCVTSLLHEAEK